MEFARCARAADDLVQLTEKLVQLQSPAHRQRIKLRSPAQPVGVSGDGARLQRVIQNLLGNALSHTPESSAVELEIAAGAGEVSVTVSDQGPGIAPEHLPFLFDRSFRVPGTKSEGLGLGLYIARLIVAAHHGRIEVESEAGRGTRFRFSIPTA